MKAQMLSVVIACYNVEQYVEQAVRSVMEQTHKELEIICVDDGSTDRTLCILEKLAAEDDRLSILKHEKNQGLFAVRCHGAQSASGEFITFLDGDDYLSADVCRAAMRKAIRTGAEVVQFGMEMIDEQHAPKDYVADLKRIISPYKKRISPQENLVNACFLKRQFSWNACGKLFRTGNVKRAVQYFDGERLIMAEDMLLTFMTLVHSRGYAPLRMEGYCYRQGSGVTAAASFYPVERMRVYAEEYQVYQLLDDWLTRIGNKEKYADALAFVKKRVATDMFYTMTLRIRPQDRSKATEILTQYWPVSELATGLAASIPWMEEWKDKAEMMESLRDCAFLKVEPRAIRTVGLYVPYLDEEKACRTALQLLTAWKAAGCQSVLFTERETEQSQALLQKAGRTVLLPSAAQGTYEEIDARAAAWTDAIDREEIDVMVYHNWFDQVMMSDSIIVRAAGIPIILYTDCGFSQGFKEAGFAPRFLAATQKSSYSLFDIVAAPLETDCAWWNAIGYRAVLMTQAADSDERKRWQEVFELISKQESENAARSQRAPLEAAVCRAMKDISESLFDYAPVFDMDHSMVGMCEDKILVKLYHVINRFFPKGGAGRKMMKKAIGVFRHKRKN